MGKFHIHHHRGVLAQVGKLNICKTQAHPENYPALEKCRLSPILGIDLKPTQ